MENTLPAVPNFSATRNDDPDANPETTATSDTAKRPKRPSTEPRYDVFISHAGEDKATIAFPLRERLMKHGITAFVDETDIERGADAQQAMIDAMETARVAVIVLSPEFVARKWPIKELMCFLRRREESNVDDAEVPVIIPFFYRLTIDDLYREPRLDRRDKDGNRLYEKSRFFERMKNGEPEADIGSVEASLRKLQGIMGVRNDFEASNDSAHIMYRKRQVLLQELCDKIRKPVAHTEPLTRTATDDQFRAYFETTQDISDLVFTFCNQNEESKECSQEARLLERVLDESQTENTNIAVRGIGGVGKTSLMRGISSLDRVKQHFKDGVYHLSLGVDGTKRGLTEELRKAVQKSGGLQNAEALRSEKNFENATEGFRSWFENRKCLFIVDDVWQTREISASVIHALLRLHVSGQNSKVLMTTRNHNIASWAGTYFGLKPRGTIATESRNILMRYAGIKPEDEEDRKAVDEILEVCKGLPLFLAVAGKAVNALTKRRGHEGCTAYHVYARNLQVNLQTMLTTDIALYTRLDASLITSLDLLEDKNEDFGFQVGLSIREMHRRLSVLRKQSKVPMTMLKFLWELDDESQAAFIAGEFENVGLADLEFEKRDSGHVELLRLHDSLHEFAVMETRKHGEESVGHESLLRGYGHGLAMREMCHEWWHTCIKADGYIHGNLCRHLLAAGRATELFDLLMSPQWAERQMKINGILSLEADFSVGLTALQDRMIDASDQERSEVEEALQLISEAVTSSSGFIASNKAELWFQLHARLKGYGEKCRAVGEYVAWIEREAARPLILCKSTFLRQPGGANTRIIYIGVGVQCMVMMKDGERVACGCRDGRCFIVNVKRSVVEKQWKAHDQPVDAIAVGTRLVSGSRDGSAKVWEIETGRCVTIFKDHSGRINDIAVIGDGRRVISVSSDGTAKVWNTETGQTLSKPFTGHGRAIECVTMLGDGEELVMTGGRDKKLRIWNATTSAQVGGTFDGHKRSVKSVAVTPDGKRVVSGSHDWTVRVWEVGSHQQIGNSLEGHIGRVNCVTVSGDGRRLVSASWDRTIRVWDLESGTEICDPLEGHTNVVTGVSFMSGVDCIVSCSEDGTVRVWDVTRKNTQKLTNRHGWAVSSVSFTPDGKFVVSASWDKTLRIWNTTLGQQIGDPLNGHSDYCVNDVAVTPDGRRVVSVSDDKRVRLWDLESRELLHTLNGHTDEISCVAVTPQGDRAVTGSDDKTVRVWNLTALDSSHVVLEGHSAYVYRVFVTDDGLRIVSVDSRNNIFVWELETKKLVERFTKEDAQKLSRRETLNLVGETTIYDDTTLSIQLRGRQIVYGEGPDPRVLATLEAAVTTWALSPDKKTICVGLYDGQVGFLKLET